MIVTKDDYRVDERVTLSQTGIDYWNIYNPSIIEIFQSSDVFLTGKPRYYLSDLGEFSWWCTVQSFTGKENPLHLSMCISEITTKDTPGFFLEYHPTYDLKTILGNLDILKNRL